MVRRYGQIRPAARPQSYCLSACSAVRRHRILGAEGHANQVVDIDYSVTVTGWYPEIDKAQLTVVADCQRANFGSESHEGGADKGDYRHVF